MLRRWVDFARFIDDGRISSATTPPKERCVASTGKAQLDIRRFQRRTDRPQSCLPLITTARLNDVDPKLGLPTSWPLTDLPASRLHEAAAWEWKRLREADKPADRQAALTSTQRHRDSPPRPRACANLAACVRMRTIMRPSSYAYRLSRLYERK